MTTILTESEEFTVDAANGLWLTAADAVRVTGWTLKPEGMCALAHAHFQLGVWLRRRGAVEDGSRHLAEASRRHPESSNMWRQSADLEAVGNAAGPGFWARVHALGDEPYHRPPDLPGFPTLRRRVRRAVGPAWDPARRSPRPRAEDRGGGEPGNGA